MNSAGRKNKVLVIGWDAADWKIIHPLLDAGQLPALEKLINRGSMGKLATLDPPLSPILWTSIATGKTADKHGVLNFTEPNTESGDIQPVTVQSRKVKAIWNILTQAGFKTNLVGWWPSHPAEPINGISVSNFYQRPVGKIEEAWPLPPNAIHPKELEPIFEELRVHPGEINASLMRPFVPELEKTDQSVDKSLHTLASLIASCSTIQSAATWIMENSDWDFMGVYFDSIDHFCHGFMKYHPPQMDGIPDHYFELYKDVVNSAYRFQDMMLERLIQLAGEDTTILLLSDHGFHSDHLRPKRLPQEPAAPALEHSPYGILCMAGKNIRPDETIYGANLLDIAPTILSLFDLPIGNDMDGKPLLSAFIDPPKLSYIDSWENVPGNAGLHPEHLKQDPWAAQEAMEQLIELGYIDQLDGDKQTRIKKSKDESDFYLARVLMHAKKFDTAISILQKLLAENPDATRYGLRLAACYQSLQLFDPLRKIVEQLRTNAKEDLPQLDLLEGILLLSENKPRQALELLSTAEKTIPHFPYLHIQLGNVYNKIHRWDDAGRAYAKALDIDTNSYEAYYGLGFSLLRRQEYEAAADALLTAIGLHYNYPEAHFHLGETLYHLEEYTAAADAFTLATRMVPGYRKAYQWLEKIYTEHLHQPELAKQASTFMNDQIKKTIYVVSGLPRSGTSMMMQMLQAGGIPVLTDALRAEDNNNPKGYLEFEKVKALAKDNSWLAESEGKVVKIIAQLLQFLPGDFQYKIIFMNRDMKEVLTSQQKMLGKDSSVFPMGLADVFSKQLARSEAWIKSQPNMEVLYVNYSDVVQNPAEQAENIESFLGMNLNLEKMVAAVDGKLYRNKNSN